MISLLLSAYNESSNPFFWQTIELVKRLQLEGHRIEILVGATKGNDDTLANLEKREVFHRVVQTTKRGERYNVVLKESSADVNDWIILNHPRSLLQAEAILSLLSLNHTIKWGAFTHQFDFHHPLLAFTSWWSNNVRGDLKKIYYLDHCLFIRKGLLEVIGGVPTVEIFEDTILTKKLSEISTPVRLNWKSTTSAIRFLRRGVWEQSLQNQLLKIRFMLGASDSSMNNSYERDINLNR
jgi:hypothetical protein